MTEGKSGATPLEGDGKRILLVLGTPKKNSLCHALAEAYSHGARSRGHVVRQLKLGEMQFDPILRDGYEQSQSLEPDLLEAQLPQGSRVMLEPLVDVLAVHAGPGAIGLSVVFSSLEPAQ